MSNSVDSHPQVIDIADLRAPVLTPLQRSTCQAAERNPVAFSEVGILDEARRRTGLNDFGCDDFRERLHVWISAINADTDLSALRRASLHTMCVGYAASRLRLEDLVRRNPGILQVEIDRPIIVAGLPRSGTTHLVSVLSADSRLRTLPWWEATAPFPAPDDASRADEPNPRRARAAADWQRRDALVPYMKALHEFSPDHISEDIELQALDFSSYLLEWLAHVPDWRDYYLSHDQTGTYAYLKKAMQALTFLHGPNRWVIKCPQHMEQLPALRRVFPDGIFVITHRDPVASIQSAITMTAYNDRVSRKRVDVDMRAAYWIDRYETLLRRCVADRNELPADRSIDVYFHDLVQAPDPILREIYRMAEIPLTDTALAELNAYIAGHPSGRHGKVLYNLRRDTGLTPDEVRARFGFYFEKFPVRVEVE